ncbi:MAG: phage portal protein [Christensenellales bacterium]|jgi:SPP1 family phage portal protein
MIVRDEKLIEGGITPAFLMGCLKEHEIRVSVMEKLAAAYASKPAILARQVTEGMPNNKLVHNYARYIVAVASGYLIGNPVSYEGENIDSLLDAYKAARADSVDAELAKDASLYGKGVELCYADEQARPRTAALDPRSAFVVYGNDVASTPLLGVRYYSTFSMDGKVDGMEIHAYTNSMHMVYRGKDREAAAKATPEMDAHYFDGIPIVEYWNNDDETGDFEHVMTLIDAYDILQSDRVNDKEQFVQALLVLTGVRLETEPDILDEKGEVIKKGRTPAQQIRQDKMLMLPDNDATAEYLVKQLAEADVEILKDAINADIHKLAMVPDLSDENFAGNVSGVAMKYKLFGLEQLTKVKERWFEEALRERLKLFANFLAVKGQAKVDADAVDIVFRRALPANELELSQMVAALNNIVPTRTLLGQLPFVQDVDAAYDEISEEKAKNLKRQQTAFGMPFAAAEDDDA